MRKSSWAVGTALAAVTMLLPIFATAEIGSVGAVNREMTGTKPVAEPTLLVIGDLIVQNELIETTATGSGQLLFLDQTTLSIAPLTSIVLDTYVYNPDRQTGEIAVSVAKGALRFIGGRITKQEPGEIATPSASIAVRGGMILSRVGPDGVTEVINLASSSVTVSQNCDNDGDGFDDGPSRCQGAPSSVVTLSRQGAKAVAGPSGVIYTGLATAAELAATYVALEGEGDGGIDQPPTTMRIVEGSREVAPFNSQLVGGLYGEPLSTTGEALAGSDFNTLGDPNAQNQEFGTLAERLNEQDDLLPPDTTLMQPDPSIIAGLDGTALYSGPASGIQTFISETPSQDVSGRFDLIYDFGERIGGLDLNVTDGTFSVDVAADPSNIVNYSGSDLIFSGPGTVSAEGGFFVDGDDPRGLTAGEFTIELPDGESVIGGSYQGPRVE